MQRVNKFKNLRSLRSLGRAKSARPFGGRYMYRPIIKFLLIILFSYSAMANDVETVNPNEIQLGPIVHESLSEDILKRIRLLTDVFESVDGIGYEQSVDLYKRDLNPEANLLIYEEMAKAYSKFCEGRCASENEKLEAYRAVLLRSMFSSEETLKQLEFNSLSEAEAIELLNGYKLEPEPITVYEEQ